MSYEDGIINGLVLDTAKALGAPEDGMRLMISLVLGYPLALIHRYTLYGKSANLQHLYHVVTGLTLCYFNFGESTVHSLLAVLFNYSMLMLLQGSLASVVLAYVFNTVYLVVGFTYTMDDEKYGVRWTTAHCVLVLKHIGLALDLYDGKKKEEERSAEQKETALAELPSALEVAGFIFHYGGFLTGPQFSMTRYRSYVSGAYSDKVTGGLPQCIRPGVKRMLAGLAYTAVYQVSALYLPTSYLLTDHYMERSFLGRVFMIALWGKLHIYKYFGVWLLAEGSMIMCGLSYNGEDENKNTLWNACANIHIRKFEFALKMNDIIMSFNVNTNKWMAKYLFKRLKWMGSKELSQGATLAYLALWHGIHTGYFHNFFMEFIIMNTEKGIEDLYAKSPALQQFMSNPVVYALSVVMRKFYTIFSLSYPLLSFCLFTYYRYFPVYFSVYCVGHIPFLLFPIVRPHLKRMLCPPKPHTENGKAKSH